jgi:hypothetical protein
MVGHSTFLQKGSAEVFDYLGKKPKMGNCSTGMPTWMLVAVLLWVFDVVPWDFY